MRTSLRILSIPVLFFMAASCQTPPPDRRSFERTGTHFALATQGEESTRIGAEILKKGGSVIDAAIAVSFAISVERPQSTGIGGGGFLIYYDAKTKGSYVLDFRDQAGSRSSPGMYLDSGGNPTPSLSTTGTLAIAVPGLVEGLRTLHHSGYSRLPFAELVEPAQRIAQRGVRVTPHLAHAIESMKADLEKDPYAKRRFFRPDGTPLRSGDLLLQPELATTLGRLAKDPRDFYRGTVAKEILKTLHQSKTAITASDLSSYRAKTRMALEGSFSSHGHAYQVLSMPPPSSGGIHVLQVLKMMALEKVETKPRYASETLHLLAEAFQQAYADRATHLGDPDFVSVPVNGLLSEGYLRSKIKEFNPIRARKAEEVMAGTFPGTEKNDTTHFSIMDQEGNAVVSTQTVNGYFGSRVFVKNSGFVLNNGMDDFSQKAGALNLFGAVGGKKNLPEPGKRPLSSMSPTIVLENGKPVLALGCPNGTRIISGVAQVILNRIFYQMDLFDAVRAPRIHHQWQPDELWLEEGPLAETASAPLAKMGYRIKPFQAQNFIQAVSLEKGTLTAVSDPRDVAGAIAE